MPKSKTRKVSPRKQLSKRKRENSAEVRQREASDELRKRLSSQEANRLFFNKLFKNVPKIRYAPSSKKENLNRLNRELAKSKNETTNLLSSMKRKFTFKLGKHLGTKI